MTFITLMNSKSESDQGGASDDCCIKASVAGL